MIFLLSAIRTNSLKSGFKDGIPRLFGEKQFGAPNPDVTQGSPPPMRGKVALFERTPHELRITPAYAGKSAQVRQCQGSSRDHPRLCGEKTENRQTPAAQTGSPPPMRGKVPIHDTVFFHVGITPAYAGKSMELSSNIMVSKDHPRLCGEKASTKAWELWGTGSPPPIRGKGSSTAAYRTAQGITPAYAGKSGA